MFWLGFIIYWMLMSTLFIKGSYIEGIIIAYLLPTVYSLVAYFSSKKDGYIIHLLHFITFLIISIINAYLLFLLVKQLKMMVERI